MKDLYHFHELAAIARVLETTNRNFGNEIAELLEIDRSVYDRLIEELKGTGLKFERWKNGNAVDLTSTCKLIRPLSARYTFDSTAVLQVDKLEPELKIIQGLAEAVKAELIAQVKKAQSEKKFLTAYIEEVGLSLRYENFKFTVFAYAFAALDN